MRQHLPTPPQHQLPITFRRRLPIKGRIITRKTKHPHPALQHRLPKYKIPRLIRIQILHRHRDQRITIRRLHSWQPFQNVRRQQLPILSVPIDPTLRRHLLQHHPRQHPCLHHKKSRTVAPQCFQIRRFVSKSTQRQDRQGFLCRPRLNLREHLPILLHRLPRLSMRRQPVTRLRFPNPLKQRRIRLKRRPLHLRQTHQRSHRLSRRWYRPFAQPLRLPHRSNPESNQNPQKHRTHLHFIPETPPQKQS